MLNREQMEKLQYRKVLFSTLFIIILLLVGFFSYRYIEEEKKEEPVQISITEEEKRFKEEYESLNETFRKNGIKNKTIAIPEENHVVYKDVKEIVSLIKEGTGVIYFGFAACPWCRNAVPLLLEAVSTNHLETLYYVNVRPDDNSLQDIRDSYFLDANNKATKEKEGDPYYSALLELLSPVLKDYELTGKNGKKVLVGEKRLSAPLVVTIKNGQIIDSHIGTLEEHTKDVSGDLRDLTEEEEKRLLETYNQMLKNFLKEGCSIEETC